VRREVSRRTNYEKTPAIGVFRRHIIESRPAAVKQLPNAIRSVQPTMIPRLSRLRCDPDVQILRSTHRETAAERNVRGSALVTEQSSQVAAKQNHRRIVRNQRLGISAADGGGLGRPPMDGRRTARPGFLFRRWVAARRCFPRRKVGGETGNDRGYSSLKPRAPPRLLMWTAAGLCALSVPRVTSGSDVRSPR
jgi:hypothetical protein